MVQDVLSVLCAMCFVLVKVLLPINQKFFLPKTEQYIDLPVCTLLNNGTELKRGCKGEMRI